MIITLAENTRTAANATIKRATLAAHKSMEQLDSKAISQLEIVYKQSAADIASRIAQHAGPDGNLKLQEMRSALQQVNAEVSRLSELRNVLLSTGIEQAANLGVQPYTQVVNGIYANLTPAAGQRVANEAVRFVRSFVAEDGLQLSDRIWRIDAQTRDIVTNAIERAVIQGQSASQAAVDFLARSLPVPADVAGKINAANAGAISKTVEQALLKDSGSPMENAMRLFRTEINRAHGEAYMKGGEDHPDFGGWRYLLSPAHPKPDICDLLSTQNLFGLGNGVYPDRARTPWPAHPNTLSFVVIVFSDEVTPADKNGKETPLEALKRLTPEQQRGVLGKGKQEIFKAGVLTQGMIRTPLRSVKTRITSLETAMEKKRVADKAAAAQQAAAKAAAEAALKAAQEKAKQIAAQAQIDEIAKAGKGYTWQALQQIKKSGLTGVATEQLDLINSTAAVIAAKKQISNALGKYKKAMITGKTPPPHSVTAFEGLSDVEKKLVTDAIDKAKADAAKEALAAGQIRFADFEQVGTQKGSNPGGLYRHKATGEQWYIKTPASEDFARNELLANQLYRAIGIDVPEVLPIQVNGKTGVASKIIEGLKADKAALASGRVAGTYDGFAADAWLGNWDVAGLNFDNMMVKDGKAWRIDSGGALRYRAQGGLKGKEWGAAVQELETLRNAQTNPQTAAVFGKMTRAQLEASAQRLNALPDDDIRRLVKEFGPLDAKDNAQLADTLIARKQDIMRRVAADVSPLPAPADAAARISIAEHKLIQESRVNGLGVLTDKGDIEDQQVLTWIEKSVSGQPVTVGYFKVTEEAGKALAKIAKLPAGVEEISDNGLYGKFVEAIKGIASMAGKGEVLREKDIARVKDLAKLYTSTVRELGSNAQIGEFSAHYRPWLRKLEDAVSGGEGKQANWNVGGNLLAQFQFKPVMPAAGGESGIQFAKVSGVFNRSKIEKGFVTRTEAQNYTKGYFYEAEIDGVKVRYWPDKPDLPFAFRNQVEIISAGDSRDASQRIFETIQKLGVNTTRPAALDREELYLRQIAYHRRDGFAEFNAAAAAGKTQQERIDAMKGYLNTAAGQDITKSPFYNPDGTYQAFGQGHKHLFRPDLAGKDWDKFQRDYALHHHVTQGGVMKSLETILNSGGQMAPTLDKLRRGLPIGGMSPDADLDTGGAAYTFTRIRKLETALKSEGLVWKPRLLARLDSISYGGDMFGRVTGNTVIQNRKTGVAGWREAARGGSNETIFKNGLSIFDELQHIMVRSDQVDSVVKLFQKHGYNTWPDGRALTDVVKAIGSV